MQDEMKIDHTTLCEKCPDKICLKSKLPQREWKPCQRVENYLNRKESDKELLGINRKYTDRHTRRKEISFDPDILEIMAGNIATNLKHGLPKHVKKKKDSTK